MKCVIKYKKNDSFFCRNITKTQNHWVSYQEARVFKTIKKAEEIIKKYNLKNVEVIKCMK
jgi:hypothetical protein